MSGHVPEARIRGANDGHVNPRGRYVLYWMTANRRASHNFALDRAVAHAKALGKPLLVLEALRCDYQWASDRLHAFVLQGMADNQAAFAGSPVRYYPYVEPSVGAGRGLFAELANRACVVVADDYPCFFLPRMLAAAARATDVRVEAVDSNGLLPVAAPGERVFTRAFDFRRWLQKNLPTHLDEVPSARPLAGLDLPVVRLPSGVTKRWPMASAAMLSAKPTALGALPIDHTVDVAPTMAGGSGAGRDRLRGFLKARIDNYDEDRNHPDRDGASGLSPWLHFGHLSAHEVFAGLAKSESWDRECLSGEATGGREGYWGMSASAEAFLDQFVTWRELGFNFCARRPDYDQFESLPDWARATLNQHEPDPRPHLYSFEELDEARTHDEVWNAAQTQLRREGVMHNYLRMLWGKKVLEWSPTPEVALQTLVELNNRYALDGRDPNSYSGIFWVFGRYDRAWGPERPIFGKIRYMTSDSTKRKLRLKNYLKQYASEN